MAEEEPRTQTAGTVLKKLGLGTPWTANQTAVADMVRSGTLDRQDVNTLTGWQLGALGGKGYMDLYPEVYGGYGGNPPRCPFPSPEAMEMASLRALKNSLIGVGMEIYRTMIDNRISSIRRMYAKTKVARAEKGFPIPDWMRPILGLPPLEEETVETGRGRDPRRDKEKTSTMSAEELRKLTVAPLGAQTELDVDQQKYLSSFLAWQKAGAPSGMGMGMVGGRQNAFMETLQRMTQSQGDYWAEAQRKWQSMFPQGGRLGVQKRIASQ